MSFVGGGGVVVIYKSLNTKNTREIVSVVTPLFFEGFRYIGVLACCGEHVFCSLSPEVVMGSFGCPGGSP